MGSSDVEKAVAETRAALERQLAGSRPRPNYGAPPPPVRPDDVPPEMVDECFGLDHLGDARILVHLFRNRYLRDNNTSVEEKDNFKHIYQYTGTHWKLASNRQYKLDFMAALGDVWKLRAEEFFEELKALAGAQDIAKLRHRHKSMGRDAPPEEVDLLKKADAYLARSKKCLALPRVMHAADLAFSGADSLGFEGTWNDHPTWLPCANGTVDQVTGILMEPKPEHYFNRCLKWNYQGEDAPCPTWLDTVNKVLGYDPVMIDYVEHMVGVAATGIQTKDFFVAYGASANNGKSLFFEVLVTCLAPFCETVDVDMLLKQSSKNSAVAHPETLRLRYARLVVTREADSSDVFDASKVKHMTSGGDQEAIRTLHSDVYHKFAQTHTLCLHTNSTPRIYGADPGLGSRIKILPFDSIFKDLEGAPEDPEKRIFQAGDRGKLLEVFNQEMSGILGWVVRCARKFLANGRRLPPPPPAVAEESAEFMIEGDIVSQYLDAKAIWADGFEVRGQLIYKNFVRWCEEERNMKSKDILSQQLFGREMKKHAKRKRDKDGVVYLGLTIPLIDY